MAGRLLPPDQVPGRRAAQHRLGAGPRPRSGAAVSKHLGTCAHGYEFLSAIPILGIGLVLDLACAVVLRCARLQSIYASPSPGVSRCFHEFEVVDDASTSWMPAEQAVLMSRCFP